MNAKAYFASYLKSNLKSVIIISAISLAFCFIIGESMFTSPRNSIVAFGLPVAVLFICCLVIPILCFATFKTRKNLDLWYSIPISKRQLGFIHHMVGAIMVLIPFTLCYIQNVLILFLSPSWSLLELNLFALVPHYLVCLLFGFALYSFYAFLFNRANTVTDGVLTILLGTSVMFLISGAVVKLLSMVIMHTFNFYYYGDGFTFMSILRFTIYTLYTVEKDVMMAHNALNTADIIWLVFWIVSGFGCAVGNVMYFGKQRAEKTQEISASFFCYRTLVPIYALCGMIVFHSASTILNTIVNTTIMILAIVGYLIYRRGFRFKLSDGIILSTLGVLSLVLSTVL